jgi:ribonuclease R
MTKKKNQQMRKEILAFLKQTPGVPVSRKIISHSLGVTKSNYHLFMDTLIGLAKAGTITHIKKMHYAYPKNDQKLVGELRTTAGGFGFVNIEEHDYDVFISPSNLNTALDRDIVQIQLYSSSGGKRLEGFVKKIVQRFREVIVGVYHQTEFYRFVTPDDPKLNRDIVVRKEDHLQAKNGQKVLVKFERWENEQHNPEGKIIEILGMPNDPGVDVVSVAYSYNLPVKFNAHLETETAKISGRLTKKSLEGRLDFRNEVCFTIDPVDAKDFDDAVSLQKLENGLLRLGVHIADVSHYVAENSEVDKEAWKRGTSIYLVDRVVPMLPERLSNHLCSLKPHKDRLAYSCFMDMDERLNVIHYQIMPSVINSKRRFHYEEAQEIIDGKMEDAFSGVLQEMRTLSKQLIVKRFENGGIDFETPEVRFVLDKKGKPKKIIPKKRLDTHRMIEEFMLLANQTVARHIKNISPNKNKLLPFLYRVHEKPDEQKMQRFFELLTALEAPFKPVKKITSKYFQNILTSIKGKPEEIVIEEVALRSMMKAVYSEKNKGHFGLGFIDYAHFTSPIRRYPDLAVHRLLKLYRSDENSIPPQLLNRLSKTALQATKMERLAMEAERESIKLKKAEYLFNFIGKEYTGIVSGILPFGFFVELHETYIEGRVRVEDMKDDYYIHDEKSFSFIGKETENVIRLGDEVKIKVLNVNLERKQIDFELLENLSHTPGRLTRTIQKSTANRKPRRAGRRKRKK